MSQYRDSFPKCNADDCEVSGVGNVIYRRIVLAAVTLRSVPLCPSHYAATMNPDAYLATITSQRD